MRDTITKAVEDMVGSLQPLIDGVQTFFDTLTGAGPKEPKPSDFITPMSVSTSDIIRINPSDKAISLWDFYEGEGFIEKFSWTEFQKMAVDAGWDGNAIKPGDILSLIAPSGTGSASDQRGFWETLLPPPPSPEDMWRNFDRANMEASTAVPEDTSFGGRLAAAVTAAWPKVETALGDMWTNFQTWVSDTALPAVDDWGSGALDSVARWFLPSGSTGKGDSPVYNALKSLLSGDIGAAAAEIGGFFNEKFPQVSASLGTFFTNIGNWIMNEGVPTVARSIGYLGGKLVVLLNSAISGAFAFITGQGGGPSAGDVTSGIQDKVLTPQSG